MNTELLRQPDKYMKYGFIHQPWDLLLGLFSTSKAARRSRRRKRSKWVSA